MDSTQFGSNWRADAPAKLNLFLEVIGKRDDGYHEIETLMVAASIYDTLYFSENQDGTVELTGHWATGRQAAATCRGVSAPLIDELPSGHGNTVWRAIELFRRVAGVKAGARLHLVKRIPSAAGLGGASSDAAAALVVANRAWRVGWGVEELRGVAAQIGSDIPFFIDPSPGSKMAICRGRGEQVTPVGIQGRLHFVVVQPPVGLSTAEVYSECQPADRAAQPGPLIDALRESDLAAVGRRLFNRLELTAAKFSPWIRQLQAQFQRLDVLGFRMSGSGSSFFGVCRHRRHASRVASRLRAAGVGQVFAASSVSPHCRLAVVST